MNSVEHAVMLAVISELRANRIPYGLMGQLAQETISKVVFENLIYYNQGGGWQKCVHGTIFRGALYRIKADYVYPEPEPRDDYVEYEIFDEGGRLTYRSSRSDTTTLDVGLNRPNFVGFKYANGKVSGSIRMYDTKGHSYCRSVSSLKDVEIHVPTHVVFRKNNK